MIRFFIVLALLGFVVAVGTASAQSPSVVQEEEDFLFAEQLASKNMHDLAANQFREYAEKYASSPRAAEALFLAGKSLDALSQWGESVAAYTKLLLRFPSSVLVDQALYRRGLALSNLGEDLQAAKSFERVALFSSTSEWIPEAQLQAGRAYLRASEEQSAMDALFVLLEDYPTHPLRLQARYTLARVFDRRKDYERALQELDRIEGERLDSDLSAQAGWLRAQILQSTGRYGKADSVLNSLISSGLGSDTIGIAAIHLAASWQLQGHFQESRQVAEQALRHSYADSIQNTLYRLTGDNCYALGLYEMALQNLQRIPESAKAVPRIDLVFRKAMTNQALGRHAEALAQFRFLIQLADSLDWQFRVKAESALFAADILLGRNQTANAVQVLRQALRQPLAHQFGDRVLLKLAQIQGDVEGDWTGARRSLASVFELYPSSTLVDDAQFTLAQSYEQEGNWTQARQEYRRYLRDFPGGDATQTVMQRLKYLDRSGSAEMRTADQAFNRLLDLSLSGSPRPELLAQWLHEQIYTFRNYSRALSLVRQILSEENRANLPAQQLLFEIAHCHVQLAESESDPELRRAHLDTVHQTVDLLTANYPRNPWTWKAVALKADVNIASVSDLEEQKSLLQKIIADMTNAGNDSLANDYRLQLARLLHSEADLAALQEIQTIVEPLLRPSVSPVYRAQALYYVAVSKVQQTQIDTARVLLQRAIELAPHLPQQVSAHYLLAQLYWQGGDRQLARAAFEKTAELYPYSRLGQDAALMICRLLLDSNRQSAGECVEQLISPELPEGLWIYLKPINTDEEKKSWFYAQTRIDPQNPRTSYYALIRYLNAHPAGSHREEALSQAANLALELQQRDAAIGLLEQLADYGKDPEQVMEARNRIADLYFQQERYKKALDYTIASFRYLQDRHLATAKARAAQCEYKLGNLSRGDALAEELKKSGGSADLLAQVYYERGLLLMQQKDFKEAEKTFKSISSDYEKSGAGGKGELGLARLYVVLNRTDDALKRLVDLTTQSKDQAILAEAYLNLADFYYENRQLENCIYAASKVLEVQNSGREHRLALNLLMNAYDDVRLWDRAVQMARMYLDAYPQAEDRMAKETKIGVFLYYLKEYDRSLTHLRDLKSRVDADTQTEIQYWIAKAEADRGNHQTAISEFLKVKYVCKQTRWPWGVTALYEAGQLYKKLGELAKARDLFEQIVRERGAADQFGRVANQKIQEIDDELRRSS
ncbi:tetratricopeptide repeat protein [candidate division KSB1 bacterium]|nr:tetratricopeptide repeat protein [candidate division KSB1 bacterium]